ncbi:hypothetical protein QTG54_005203, partial [Skeletonema marinoi]
EAAEGGARNCGWFAKS